MKRWALVVAGVFCVGLGFLGALLPGLPTTPFLLLAAWCFARSDPELGERLLAHRLFRPYRPFLDGSRPIPRRVRVVALGFVWACIALSLWTLRPGPWGATGLVGAALVGSIVIVRFRSQR